MKLTWTPGDCFRYHQISFLSGPASPPSGLGHSTVWQTSQMARQFPVTPFFVHDGDPSTRNRLLSYGDDTPKSMP